MTTYYSSEPFRESFRLVQALPFLPCDQVIDGFMSIKEQAPIKMKPFFEYVDANYVGSKKKPRFEIDTWNLYERVLINLPRTSNQIEAWHNAITVIIKLYCF